MEGRGRRGRARRMSPYPPELVPVKPEKISPSTSTPRVDPEEGVLVFRRTESGRLRISEETGCRGSVRGRGASRRRLPFKRELPDKELKVALNESSSEEEGDENEDDGSISLDNNYAALSVFRKLERERYLDAENEELEAEVAQGRVREEVPPPIVSPLEVLPPKVSLTKVSPPLASPPVVPPLVVSPPIARDGEKAAGDGFAGAAGAVGLDTFEWWDDFSTFRGAKESYDRVPGPATPSADPYELFNAVWDDEIMQQIVENTNLYAWNTIAPLFENKESASPHSRLRDWRETSVSEMRLFFAVLIYMSLDYRSRMDEYWKAGILGMPEFRTIMARDKFFSLLKFVHFVDTDTITDMIDPYSKKVAQVQPLVTHCNQRFQQLYTPKQELSLDESLLLWKGNLSWVQCIRTKAARFGIKSFDLCESESGYLLKTILYTGRDTSTGDSDDVKVIDEFQNPTAKVVLKLMDGYLDVGQSLYMDNWYNQMPLTRYLKQRRTDVVGTQSRRRQHVPNAIKEITQTSLAHGQMVWRHSGDISLVAWRDVKLVAFVSTFHTKGTNEGQRAGRAMDKPSMANDYNKNMGGVDLKDQMLSMYLMERKRATKWYLKVFRRLINTTLFNCYIIQKQNKSLTKERALTHREFRFAVADLLVRNNREPQLPRQIAPETQTRARLSGGLHVPDYTTPKGRYRRCARCTPLGIRSSVRTICVQCDVALCLGKCFEEYHTLRVLTPRRQRL